MATGCGEGRHLNSPAHKGDVLPRASAETPARGDPGLARAGRRHPRPGAGVSASAPTPRASGLAPSPVSTDAARDPVSSGDPRLRPPVGRPHFPLTAAAFAAAVFVHLGAAAATREPGPTGEGPGQGARAEAVRGRPGGSSARGPGRGRASCRRAGLAARRAVT